MKRLLDTALAQHRLVLTLVALFVASGLLAWTSMPRQEDPSLPARDALITAVFPGADPLDVERLILEPLEDELATIPQIKHVKSTARQGVAIVSIELSGSVTANAVDAVWDEVRRAAEVAARDFPEGASLPELNEDLIDQDSVFIAVRADTWMESRRMAMELQDRMLALPTVKRVNLFGDPGEQILVELNASAARQFGLTRAELAQALTARNVLIPGGSVVHGERTVALRPSSEFGSLDELRDTAIMLPSGGSVRLSDVATVRQGPEEPRTGWMRLNGHRSVGVGVVPRPNQSLSDFGVRTRAALELERSRHPEVSYDVVFAQPERLDARLDALVVSLIQGTLIVACVLILFMGVRLGLLVSLVVPLVALAALALYSWGGGVLHQISIAALVLALGLLVDNAIVVAEAIQLDLDGGASREEAARKAVGQLAFPLATATGTTLASFVPMLLAEGATGGFTRAIPIVVMTTLVTSYLFAVAVTPTLARFILVPTKTTSGAQSTTSGFIVVGRWFGSAAQRYPWPTLAVVGIIVAICVAMLPQVRFEFFPRADRNQLLIEVEMPEGTHVDATDAVTQQLERALATRPEVLTTSTYVGQAIPQFYYNVIPQLNSPHLAQVVAVTRNPADIAPLAGWVASWAREESPRATIIPKVLGQGPPVRSPIELRVYADDLDTLRETTERAMSIVSASEHTLSTRHDLGVGTPTVDVRIDDASAARVGLGRLDVARALLTTTRGVPAGTLRSGEDPVPILVRDPRGETFPTSELDSLTLESRAGFVPLTQVATPELTWRPSAVRRRDRDRTASVLAELSEGSTFSQAISSVQTDLDALDLPPGVRLEWGGQSSESGQANKSILRNVPIAMMLLLFFLLVEFDSFRRVGIILFTIPLSIAGVVPGLLLGDQPFGFMSLLGSIALVGILVNNAIVLIDQIEHRRKEGDSVSDAVRDAIATRTRPILLTVMTTISGMLPLALSPTSLWPPMAWTIIFGLLASTLLTLAVVPALYTLLFDRKKPPREPVSGAASVAAALALGGALFTGAPAHAQSVTSVTFDEAVAQATKRPRVQAATQDIARAQAAERLWINQTWVPAIELAATATGRAPTLELETPFGNFPQGRQGFFTTTVSMRQPILEPAALLHEAPAAGHAIEAARAGEHAARLTNAVEAANAYFDVKMLDANLDATERFVDNLNARITQTNRARELGAAIDNDVSRLRIEHTRATQSAFALRQQRLVLLLALGHAIGQDAPVEPATNLPEITIPTSLDDATHVALDSHPQLAALRAQRNEATARADGVRWELAPTIDATGMFLYTTEERLATDWIAQASLNVTWTPLASGTRGARADLYDAESVRRTHELTEARRAITQQVALAWAGLEIAQRDVVVSSENVMLAEDNLRIQDAKLSSGTANTIDVVEAEALLRVARAQRDAARARHVHQRALLLAAIGVLGN